LLAVTASGTRERDFITTVLLRRIFPERGMAPGELNGFRHKYCYLIDAVYRDVSHGFYLAAAGMADFHQT
jgi:hypothetical protein